MKLQAEERGDESQVTVVVSFKSAFNVFFTTPKKWSQLKCAETKRHEKKTRNAKFYRINWIIITVRLTLRISNKNLSCDGGGVLSFKWTAHNKLILFVCACGACLCIMKIEQCVLPTAHWYTVHNNMLTIVWYCLIFTCW